MKIKLTNARLSFPSLWHRSTFGGEETKFEATFLLDKDGEDAQTVRDAISELMAKGNDGEKLPSDRICVRDGDLVEYAGYAGNISIKASSQTRPMLINADKTPADEMTDPFYPGCRVNAIIDLWFMDNQFGKRVNAKLMAVQFAADDESFGAMKASEDDFEQVGPGPAATSEEMAAETGEDDIPW